MNSLWLLPAEWGRHGALGSHCLLSVRVYLGRSAGPIESDGGLFKGCTSVVWLVFLLHHHLEIHLLYSGRDKLNQEVKNTWPEGWSGPYPTG